MKFIISDIHGHYGKFKELLKKATVNLKTDTVFISGDLINRGPESIPLLRYVMNTPQMVLLTGNHEQYLLMFLNKRISEQLYVAYGGANTIRELQAINDYTKKEIANYLEKLAFYKVIEDITGKPCVISHTGLCLDYLEVNSANQNIDVVASIEKAVKNNPLDYLTSNDLYYANALTLRRLDKKIFAGHLPTQFYSSADGQIFEGNYYIGLDCGCGTNFPQRKLAMHCIDTGETFYV